MKYGANDILDVRYGPSRTTVYYGGINHNPAKVYGVSWDKGETPDLTRTDDAVGMVANVGIGDAVVTNDFDSAEIFKDFEEVTDSYGNVFVRIPKLYIRKTDGENIKTWQVSRMPFSGCYLPWCYWDFTYNRELPYVDVGKYNAGLDGSKLTSLPNTYPLVNTNIVNFRSYAQANGAGYQQLDIHVVDLLRTLFFIEFATLNSQAIMQGFTSGRYAATHLAVISENGTNRIVVPNATADFYRVGQSIGIGTSQGDNQIFSNRDITAVETHDVDNKSIVFDGDPVNITAGNMLYNTGFKSGFSAGSVKSKILTANDGKYPCSYRGIENPFGNVWQFVDGVNITDNQAWVCKNAEQYTSNVFASPYEQLSYINHNANGYGPITTGFDTEHKFAEFAASVSASSISTKYYCDYYYQTAGSTIARFGGSWHNGSTAGLSYWTLNTSSSISNLSLGGRLLRKPL